MLVFVLELSGKYPSICNPPTPLGFFVPEALRPFQSSLLV